MEKMTTAEFGKRCGMDSLQANLVVGFLKDQKVIKAAGKLENAPGQLGRTPVLYSFPAVITIRVPGAKGKKGKKTTKAKKAKVVTAPVAPVATAPVAPAPVAAPVATPATV